MSGKAAAPGVSVPMDSLHQDQPLPLSPQGYLGSNPAPLQVHLGRSQPDDASWRSTSALISA